MVLSFEDELNFHAYSNENTSKNDKSQNKTNYVTSEEHSVASQNQVDFSTAEWDYLTHHNLPQQTFDANGIEISPSMSNQTLQSFRPSFSSEYETDTTDLVSYIDHNTQHLDNNNNKNNNTAVDFGFPSSIDYNTFLENILDTKDHGRRNFDATTNHEATPNFNPANYDQSLLMLPHELQESFIGDDCNNDNDYVVHHSELTTMASTTTGLPITAISATTTTSSISSMSLAKSPTNVFVDFDDFVTSPIYEWPSDETVGPVNLTNNIKVRLANLEPKTVSDAVRRTIREEFIIQDMFLNGQSPMPPEIPKSIRKKSDRDVEWTPLSVYKAYTNIKSPTNGKDSYNHLVPYTSCIGTLNYRPKDHAAWRRAPNKATRQDE
ncbi:hypothetical protein SBY92_001505 [Candida maltosa Xu316]